MSSLSHLAVPFVYALIFFLGYPAQWLLMRLDPGPLTKNELVTANVVLVLIWITYTKSVFVDPGTIPKNWAEKELVKGNGNSVEHKERKEGRPEGEVKSRKWCRKCDAAKPPRAHHCKECKRCIPKMDHHCPWTSNCVSHTTFPHFLRFLLYSTLGLTLFELHHSTRLLHLWHTRHLPSYLGPTLPELSLLFALISTNSITLFALSILLIRNLYSLALNTTTIESWEISRHETLLRRARHFGGYLSTPDGAQIRIQRQEFPYDIGIFANIAQGMNTSNPINWFNPFGPTPSLSSGLSFKVNGFESDDTPWPPPDPDRAYRRRVQDEGPAFTYRDAELSQEETVQAFRARQAEDAVRRRKPFVQRMEAVRDGGRGGYARGGYEEDGLLDELDDASGEEAEDEGRRYGDGDEGEEGWRNSEGERLKDFGVDEDVEFYDEQEDDIPLSVLIARRQADAASAASTG
ncbi:Palmitoyltransferase [Curvularia kusanoi]|uniref:Palmitoyltransferase PFA4 n=1 Tax=Curvularia kusanoi TaxID=90978 RepID=A0A9P4W6G4_CURKU|nr:Palmitoyltransferase [Curvularia kusanoi]